MRQTHILFLVALIGLSGCASYKRVLHDSNGRTITCEAHGKNGILTGYYLRKGFNDCIDKANAEGFK